MVGLRDEINERNSGSYSETSMAWFQSAMLSISTVPRAVKPAQFGQVLGHCREILKDAAYCVGSLGLVGDAFGHKLQFLRHSFRKSR